MNTPKRWKKVTAVIGGVKHRYDSTQEFYYALYLQLLKEQGQIQSWEPEPVRFDFHEHNYRTRPREYTPDFGVIELDGSQIYVEYKGWLQTMDLTRIRRAWEHYENEDGSPLVFDLAVPEIKLKGKGSKLFADALMDHRIRNVIPFGRVSVTFAKALMKYCDKIIR